MSVDVVWAKFCISSLFHYGHRGTDTINTEAPHDNIFDLTTLKLCETLEITFIRPRNIFSIEKKAEIRWNIWTTLKYPGRTNWKLYCSKSWRRHCTRHIFNKHVRRRYSLRIATWHRWTRQSIRFCSKDGNGANKLTTNFFKEYKRPKRSSTIKRFRLRPQQRNKIHFNREHHEKCKKCGMNWTTNRWQVCIAIGKKSNHCGLLDHFAKVSGKKRPTKTHHNLDELKIVKIKKIQTFHRVQL